MGSVFAFDTLAFAKKLRSAGYTDAQAEALAEAQGEVIRQMLESTLATKEDIREMATKDDIRALDRKIDSVASKLDRKIDSAVDKLDWKYSVVDELGRKIDRLGWKIDLVAKDLKIWFGGMLAVAIGVVTALIKLL